MEKMLPLVIENCEAKIVARLKKICVRLRELGEKDNFGVTSAKVQAEGGTSAEEGTKIKATEYEDKIRQAVGQNIFPVGCPLAKFLKCWFQSLVRKVKEGAYFNPIEHKEVVNQAIFICYYLSRRPKSELTIEKELFSRIEKLGDYLSAIKKAIKEIGKLDRVSISKLSIKQVSWSLYFEIENTF